MKFLFCD